MKTQFSFLLTLLFLLNLHAQDAKPLLVADAVAETKIIDNGMRWDQTTHDFGTIPINEPKKATFEVTNSGDTPLLITDVKSSCGCTGASASEGPVLPGESTIVTATYNAKRAGAFRKTVKVKTNRSDSPIVLTVTGTVSE